MLIYFLALIGGILFIAFATLLLMSTADHLNYLNQQEKYWTDVKAEREAKEKQENG